MPPSLAQLGLAYPLSSDWILATTMIRTQFTARNPSSNASVLLAAVYVPEKAKFSESSPFFSLLALHEPHADCKLFLDATVGQLEKQDKVRVGKADEKFPAGTREFYRTDFEQKGVLRHRSLICTTEKDYLLLWNASARNDNGIEAVVSTLNSIAPATSPKESEAAETGAVPRAPQVPVVATPLRVRVSSAVQGGLLIKKVPPVYPAEARQQYIQGTVILKAEISKEGIL